MSRITLSYAETNQPTQEGGSSVRFDCSVDGPDGQPIRSLFSISFANHDLEETGHGRFSFILYLNPLNYELGMSDDDRQALQEFIRELLNPTTPKLQQFGLLFHGINVEFLPDSISMTLEGAAVDVPSPYLHADAITKDWWYRDIGFVNFVVRVLEELQSHLNAVFNPVNPEEDIGSPMVQQEGDMENGEDEDAASLPESDMALKDIDPFFEEIINVLDGFKEKFPARHFLLQPQLPPAGETSDPDYPSSPGHPEGFPDFNYPALNSHENSDGPDPQQQDRVFRMLAASSLDYRDAKIGVGQERTLSSATSPAPSSSGESAGPADLPSAPVSFSASSAWSPTLWTTLFPQDLNSPDQVQDSGEEPGAKRFRGK